MNARVAILSFEGPDRYSLIGGLGTRVTELAQALADAGHPTELFFVGDPNLPSVEEISPLLHYRRWCQWISQYHPAHVYDGEHQKVNDFSASIPPFVGDAIVGAYKDRGERTIVLAEEWQTARATIELDRYLRLRGARNAATLVWNANNTYGFGAIPWEALSRSATLTTVSKYMRFEMGLHGQEPLVIPNGIPQRLLDGPPQTLVHEWRAALGGSPLLVKVGRFDPDKGWFQAIDAIADLRHSGADARLVIRGGRERYGDDILARARSTGLGVATVNAGANGEDPIAAVARVDEDVVVLRAFLEPDALHALYAAADAVLANSRKEPFGLVGLEVMAAGGLAVCGATGEEYAEPFVNAIVVDTDDGRELASYLRRLAAEPDASKRMREAGWETANRYTWGAVLEALERKLEFASQLQG
jgi:glycosyltransferase involved in cell wall biosynthesis